MFSPYDNTSSTARGQRVGQLLTNKSKIGLAFYVESHAFDLGLELAPCYSLLGETPERPKQHFRDNQLFSLSKGAPLFWIFSCSTTCPHGVGEKYSNVLLIVRGHIRILQFILYAHANIYILYTIYIHIGVVSFLCIST